MRSTEARQITQDAGMGEALKAALNPDRNTGVHYFLDGDTPVSVTRYPRPTTDINELINQRAEHTSVPDRQTRRGSGAGWDSKEARARRKGNHDLRSGRLTPESTAFGFTMEITGEACRDQRASSFPETPAETIGREMQVGQSYSPLEQ